MGTAHSRSSSAAKLTQPGSAAAPARSRTFLFITQVYVPDPAAVGQLLADAAEELARRGNRVIVLTSAQGYDDPQVRYKRRETIRGVDVRRLPLSSFGKGSFTTRVTGALGFLSQAVARGALLKGVDTVVVTTSPPMASAAALVLGGLHRARIKYWVMDINPDQLVALGHRTHAAPTVRALEAVNRRILNRADDIITLDTLMAERIRQKGDVRARIHVIPPWPAEYPESVSDCLGDTFRETHRIGERIAVMYSGNHTPSNPLSTLIDAAEHYCDDRRIAFLFVGGGTGKRNIGRLHCANVLSLPYQPRRTLAETLSAADVHVVTLGDSLAGIVHPSKAYGAMAVARPILFIGPPASPLAELVREHELGWVVEPGDLKTLTEVLDEIKRSGRAALHERGRRGRLFLESCGGKQGYCARLCDILESANQGVTNAVSC